MSACPITGRMRVKVRQDRLAGLGVADSRSDWLSQLTVCVHLERTGRSCSVGSVLLPLAHYYIIPGNLSHHRCPDSKEATRCTVRGELLHEAEASSLTVRVRREGGLGLCLERAPPAEAMGSSKNKHGEKKKKESQ